MNQSARVAHDVVARVWPGAANADARAQRQHARIGGDDPGFRGGAGGRLPAPGIRGGGERCCPPVSRRRSVLDRRRPPGPRRSAPEELHCHAARKQRHDQLLGVSPHWRTSPSLQFSRYCPASQPTSSVKRRSGNAMCWLRVVILAASPVQRPGVTVRRAPNAIGPWTDSTPARDRKSRLTYG